ncbi:MAG: YraN family protein [bacterium]|nr:YraN family protein [bacterium]
MTKRTRGLGNRGEALAAAYLRERGYQIIAQNWRALPGEIDLIAQTAQEIVFIEVKTRYDDTGAEAVSPLEAITRTKMLRLQRAAYAYLNQHALDPDLTHWRIDAVAVIVRPDRTHIDHYQDVLQW